MPNFMMERSNKYLSKEELEIFEKHTETNGAVLSPVPALKLYELFINGASCQEIAKLKTEFSIGSIIDARLRYKWDERKEEYINSLFKSTNERAVQVQMEAVQFVADLLAATHKLNGFKYKKFILTGDESVLGDMDIGSIKQYKEAIELFMSLTGQNNSKKIIQQVTIDNKSKPADPAASEDSAETKAKSAIIDHSTLLKQLEKGKK